ncbi:MAG: ABC transporter permease [Brevundimonas sp.]
MTAASVTFSLPRPGSVLTYAQRYSVYAGLVLVLLYNLFFTANFFEASNIRTQFVQLVPVLIVALGMSLVIGTEGIDLSVGASMAMAAAVLPLYIGYGFVPAAIASVLVASLIGLVNGTLVAFVGVQPIVATLSLMVGGRGLALLIAGDRSRSVSDPVLSQLSSGSVLGIPYSVLLAATLVVVVALLVSRTTFGKQLVAVGGNRRAAELSGLPVRRVLLLVYLISAVLAGIAGLVGVSRLSASVPSTLGNLIEVSAITAVVVGGTPLTGGRVKIGGTVVGVVLLQLITATLIKHDVSDAVSQIIQAAIIVLAVFLQRGRQVSR